MLLLQPERRLHVREIARLTQAVAGTMSKELDRLHKAGLLERHRVGNQVHFCANQQHPVYPELSGLLRKTIGLADVLAMALAGELSRIKVAFVFGSVAKSADTATSDVDVMVIGSVDFGSVVNRLYEAQKSLHREINPKVYSVDEWRAKRRADSSFVRDVLAKPKIFLIGTQRDLDELG
ncbi:MAG: nucleotidyltransferase domain-containing protein [Rhodoferax sp.]|mgnify:FL=1|nr:nucleotidyltransferase domain-containing protein [Rhodoferax sp.]